MKTYYEVVNCEQYYDSTRLTYVVFYKDTEEERVCVFRGLGWTLIVSSPVAVQ